MKVVLSIQVIVKVKFAQCMMVVNREFYTVVSPQENLIFTSLEKMFRCLEDEAIVKVF